MNKWKSMKTCGHSNCGTKSVYLWMLAGFRLHWSVCAKLCDSRSKSSWETREKNTPKCNAKLFSMSKSKCRDLFVFSIHRIVIRHCLEFWKCATFWNVPLRSGHLKQCKHYDRDAYIHSYNAPNGKVAAIFHWCVFAIVDCMKRGANNALSPIPFLSRNWH